MKNTFQSRFHRELTYSLHWKASFVKPVFMVILSCCPWRKCARNFHSWEWGEIWKKKTKTKQHNTTALAIAPVLETPKFQEPATQEKCLPLWIFTRQSEIRTIVRYCPNPYWLRVKMHKENKSHLSWVRKMQNWPSKISLICQIDRIQLIEKPHERKVRVILFQNTGIKIEHTSNVLWSEISTCFHFETVSFFEFYLYLLIFYVK